MQTFDWNIFSQHIDKLVPVQINHLKDLTHNHLHAGNDEKKARYIKVAYIDDYDGPIFYDAQGVKLTPPRAVLWEEHVIVRGLDSKRDHHSTDVDTLKTSLRTVYLPDDLRNLKIELYFASMQLQSQKRYSEPEALRNYLLSYCDKIYAKPLPQQSNETWILYKDYFNQAQIMILSNPALYTTLCHNLKNLFSHPSGSKVISRDRLYSYLVLLRSLPDTLARSQGGHIEATLSLTELLSLLDILDDFLNISDNDASIIAQETIYNVVNVIEWLTYLIPKMYGAAHPHTTSSTSLPLYEEVVEYLEKYISSEKYKLAIRMEAAWALGWASVSSVGVATYVHQYDKSAKWRVDRLHSSVLRHVVGTAYLRASFTLVSFGPARVSSNSVEPLPGGYIFDQTSGQINVSPRIAAANIVYDELARIVDGNVRFQLLLTVLAAFWVVTNDLIAIFFSLNAVVVIWLAAAPILILFIIMTQLTREWGRGYWWRITIIWIAFALLAVTPWTRLVNWQQSLITVGAFAAFITVVAGFLSSWLSVLAVFPTLARLLRSKLKSKH